MSAANCLIIPNVGEKTSSLPRRFDLERACPDALCHFNLNLHFSCVEQGPTNQSNADISNDRSCVIIFLRGQYAFCGLIMKLATNFSTFSNDPAHIWGVFFNPGSPSPIFADCYNAMVAYKPRENVWWRAQVWATCRHRLQSSRYLGSIPFLRKRVRISIPDHSYICKGKPQYYFGGVDLTA